MGDFNPYFALIENLGTDRGRTVFAYLKQVPLVFEALEDINFFNFAEEKIGNTPELWTPLNICKLAAGLDPHADLNEINENAINAQTPVPLNEKTRSSIISALRMAVQAYQKSKKTSWMDALIGADVLELKDDGAFQNAILFFELLTLIDRPENIFAALFSLFEHAAAPVIAATLIQLFTLKNNEGIILFENSICNLNSQQFLSLIRELEKLGCKKEMRELSALYIKKRLNFSKTGFAEKYQNIDAMLAHIQTLKNSAAIYAAAGEKEFVSEITNQINEELKNINQSFAHFTGLNSLPEENREEIGLEGIPPIPKSPESLKNISLLYSISGKDQNESRELARKIFDSLIGEDDLITEVFSEDFGFVIDPVALVKRFCDLGLIVEAHSLVEKFLRNSPSNQNLIRLSAQISHQYGDHRDAVCKFSSLSASVELTRVERIHFAKSLEILEKWEDAYLIRTQINIVSNSDLIDFAVCAYHASKFKDFLNFCKKNHPDFLDHPISQIICVLDQGLSAEVLDPLSNFDPDSIDKSTAILYKIFLADYIYQTQGSKAASNYLRQECEKDINAAEIWVKLIQIDDEMVDNEFAKELLIRINQGRLDIPYEFAIRILQFAEKLELVNLISPALQEWQQHWILSPDFQLFLARYYLDQERYNDARRLITPMLYREDVCAEAILIDCLSSLQCKLKDFPIGIRKINPKQKNQVEKLILRYPAHFSENFYLQMIELELFSKQKVEDYRRLLTLHRKENPGKLSRLQVGLGKAYFEEKRYDLSIVNLKDVVEKFPENFDLIYLLIQSYVFLQLWSDAIAVASSWMGKGSYLLGEFLQIQEVFHGSDKWEEFLRSGLRDENRKWDYHVALASFLANSGRISEAKDYLNQIEADQLINKQFLLAYVRVLIQCEDFTKAERMMEIFLSEGQYLTPRDFLVCAFLFEYMNKTERAIHSLNLINQKPYEVLAYQSYLYEKMGKSAKALRNIQKAIAIYAADIAEPIHLDDMKRSVPLIYTSIVKNPEGMFDQAVELSLRNGNVQNVSNIIQKAEEQNCLTNRLQLKALELSFWMGKEVSQDEMASMLQSNENEWPLDGYILFAEISLARNEEIAAAGFLSKAIENGVDSTRLNVLKARVIARNGNFEEALSIFNEVRDKRADSIHGPSLWLSEAAIEFEHLDYALENLEKLIDYYGMLNRPVKLFIETLVQSINASILESLFQPEKTQPPITSSIKEKITKIDPDLVMSGIDDAGFITSLDICKKYLHQENPNPMILDDLESSRDLLPIIVYLLYRNQGSDAVEILLNQYPDQSQAKLIFALLHRDKEPKKSLSILKEISEELKNKPDLYAALALVEQDLGNSNEAYAAIHLALDLRPEEIKWRKIAGELSLEIGNVKEAYSHFQEIQKHDPSLKVDERFLDQLIAAGDLRAARILEQGLADQKGNSDTLLKIGKLYFKNGNYRKAAQYLQQAAKEPKSRLESQLFLAKIALSVKNYKTANQIMDRNLREEKDHVESFALKAQVVYEQNGYEAAVNLLDSYLETTSTHFLPLVLKKVELIRAHSGSQESLKYLLKVGEKTQLEEIELMKAALFLETGDYQSAEMIIERTIFHTPNQYEALVMSAKIAHAKGNLDLAKDLYIEAIQVNPFVSANYLDLYQVYCDRNEMDQASEVIAHGLHINPESIDLLILAGMVNYKKNNLGLAKHYLQRARKVDSRNIEALNLMENIAAKELVFLSSPQLSSIQTGI